MAGRRFSILLFVFLCVQIVLNSKLNVPGVLLPIFKDFSSKFTLEATEGGCYKWSTTRTDVISLQPYDVDPDFSCSTKVVVTTVIKEQSRNMAIVLAEDVRTRQVLRCDVIVDVIDSLALITTTRELFMEEAPEAFEVRAYDAQGNEFTTLEGVEFEWKLVCSGRSKETLLRFIPFKNSPYETPITVLKIEEEDKKGHIVLLEGIKTGSAKVIVRLPFEEYKHIEAEEVQLSVIANLIITPSEAYVMVGDTVSYQIIHLNNGRMEEIELPNSQYYLDVESKVVAQADKELGEVTGLKDGKTRVVLHDRNIVDTNGINLPSAVVNVVTPAYMTLNILPHRNWAILLSEHHDIVAEVYSSNDHKLHIGSGVKIQMQVGELFFVQDRSKNGSWLTGWAKEEGVTPVQGLLEAVVHPKLGKFKIQSEVAARAELQIFPPIILNPSEVVLPWDPILKPKYEIQIKAVGCDNKFLWSSTNHSVGVVTQTGYVRTHSHGSFEVSAAMMKNHHNRQTAILYILPPSRLEIVEYVMEAEVGAMIFLHVALYAEKPGEPGSKPIQIPFTKCQELPLKVKPSDNNFVHNKSAIISPVGISCANVAIVGSTVGVSKVTVSYVVEGKTIEDSVTVSTFEPLRLIYPRPGEIVLAVGTSTQLVFTGGPRPVVGRAASHKRTVITDDNSITEAKDITDSQSVPGKQDFTVLNVLCRKLGSSEVTLSITNSPTMPNCRNQDSTATATIICGKPRSVSLKPEIKVANVHSCPMDLSADRVVVQSYKNIELDVTVTDEQGRTFLNVSSLNFIWSLSPPKLGELGSTDSVFSRNITEGTIVYANRSYQIIHPKATTGIIHVSVILAGYLRDPLTAVGIVPEWPEFVSEDEVNKSLSPITAGIHLYLVDDTVVTPNVISVYNHPGNKKIVYVKQGSGYYELALSREDIAEVKYLESSGQLEIKPLSEGELHISLIDLCLVSHPAAVIVYVVSVGIIRVEMSDKVEIGKCISCVVRLYDASDNILSIPDLGMIDLKVSLEVDNIKVKRLKEEKDNAWPPGEIHYVITGTELGDTKLTFSIAETCSAPIELQVFPPLRINPRNTTLLIGSVLQLSSSGGPQPDCTIEYSIADKSIADVSNIGLAQGLALGSTTVDAYAVGINPTTGLKVIYSQDHVEIHVIPIIGIKISTPLTRFKIRTTVPAWASGVPEKLTPLILGTVQPPFRFEWEVEDNDVVTLHGPFSPYKIEYAPEDQVSVRFTGLTPGRTKLRLNVVVPGVSADHKDRKHVIFSTSIDLEVFDGLALTSPQGVSGRTVLMAPNCQLQLKTNMDGLSKLQYSLPSPGEYPSEGSASAQRSLSIPNPLISVTDAGFIISHAEFGRAMVLITGTDEHGLKQTLSLIVEVKPVHYMLLNVVTNWAIDSPFPLSSIPLGSDFQLRATYHDNTGSVFTSGSAELRLRSTRFDLVRIRPGLDNSSVLIYTKKPGHTVLKAWASGLQESADYIKLNVQQIIAPVTDFLTTGDIICAWTPLITIDKQLGKWATSERTLVTIDVNTGVGRVVGLRGGQVAITHSLHPSTPLQMQVTPANQIRMLPSKNMILTNAPNTLPFQVPLVIVSEKNPDKKQNLLSGFECAKECAKLLNVDSVTYPFICKIAFTNGRTDLDANKVFAVRSGFDPETGQYTCVILPGTEKGPNVSTMNSNVTVWAVLDGGDIEAQPVEVHFIPSIFVAPELILDESYRGTLLISGLDYVLDGVSVSPVDKNLIQVGSEHRPAPNRLSYDVRLLDYHWKLAEMDEPLNLIVTSKVTDQIVVVHVKVKGAGDVPGVQFEVIQHSPIVSFLYSYRHTLAIVISMLIIFFITFYAYSHYIQPVINVNVNPNRSLLSSNNQLGGTRGYITTSGCPYAQRSPGDVHNRTAACINREPVYGDPSTFYSTSPEVRRNRRMM